MYPIVGILSNAAHAQYETIEVDPICTFKAVVSWEILGFHAKIGKLPGIATPRPLPIRPNKLHEHTPRANYYRIQLLEFCLMRHVRGRKRLNLTRIPLHFTPKRVSTRPNQLYQGKARDPYYCIQLLGFFLMQHMRSTERLNLTHFTHIKWLFPANTSIIIENRPDFQPLPRPDGCLSDQTNYMSTLPGHRTITSNC